MYDRDAQRAAGFIPAMPDGQKATALIRYAVQFVGKVPYSWGGETLNGWDCSGMIKYVYAHALGMNLPHGTGSLMRLGVPVPSIAQAQPGDLLISVTHAAIYIGNGLVVNALNYHDGTRITTPVVFQGAPYVIRRLL